MKKTLLVLLVTGATLTFGCNPSDNNSKEKNTKKENVSRNNDEEESETESENEERTIEQKATAELCNCINKTLANMSPRVRKIIVKAGDSDNPIKVLQTELQKISDAEEQERLGREFQEFENNPELQNCSDRIKKKYNLDDNDKKSQKRIMDAAEENEDCDVVYALMKIGIQHESQTNGTGANQ